MRGLPRWALIPALLGVGFVALPLVGLFARVDWARFPALVTSEEAASALWLSLRTSAAATALCLALGVPLALCLARGSFRGLRVVRAVVLAPLVLPPVVGGLALLLVFGRRGLVGGALEAAGWPIAFSSAAVVLAQAFVALPFLVIALEASLRASGSRLETVAATLGAAPTAVLARITLPRVAPGLASATMLAFARALGEFGATITFAGSLQGVTRTLPLEIYLARMADPDAAAALSVVLVGVAALVAALAAGVSGASWTSVGGASSGREASR